MTTIFSTEQTFDMLPHVSEIYTKLNIKEYLAKNTFKPKEGEDLEVVGKIAGMEVFAYIFKNSPKVKEEFFEIVAIFESKSVDEVKKQSLGKTIASVKAITKNEELMDFFKQSV